VKVVCLVSSLVISTCQPVLIITLVELIPFLGDEFLRVSGDIIVVIYGGNADARKIIRSLEFYDKRWP